ncbi:hypothetical protein PUT24_06435, partial [Streptomyces sp. SP17KL33]
MLILAYFLCVPWDSKWLGRAWAAFMAVWRSVCRGWFADMTGVWGGATTALYAIPPQKHTKKPTHQHTNPPHKKPKNQNTQKKTTTNTTTKQKTKTTTKKKKPTHKT